MIQTGYSFMFGFMTASIIYSWIYIYKRDTGKWIIKGSDFNSKRKVGKWEV